MWSPFPRSFTISNDYFTSNYHIHIPHGRVEERRKSRKEHRSAVNKIPRSCRAALLFLAYWSELIRPQWATKEAEKYIFYFGCSSTQVEFLLLWTKWSMNSGEHKQLLPHSCTFWQAFSEATSRFSLVSYCPEECYMLMPRPKSWQRNNITIINIIVILLLISQESLSRLKARATLPGKGQIPKRSQNS